MGTCSAGTRRRAVYRYANGILNPLSATVGRWWPAIVCFNIISTERVKLNLDIWGKSIIEWITEVKAFLMDGVADRWAVRDEQPTHLPPRPSLDQETTGTRRVNIRTTRTVKCNSRSNILT